MDSKKALAENIRQNIYNVGLTQRQYAKEIGIPYTTLLNAITGHDAVSLDTLDRIADGTGIDAWELVKVPEEGALEATKHR